MQTLQRRQVIGLTFAGSLWLILVVATFVSGAYRELPTWRIGLEMALGLFATMLLWEVWKPGGAGRK